MNAPGTLPDLTICDREPITRLDNIQPFGFLVALANDWLTIRASGNLERFLGISADDAIGTDFGSVITDEAAHTIRNRIAMIQPGQSPERIYGLTLRTGGAAFDVALHYADDMLVIEGEPVSDDSSIDAASLVRTMIGRLGKHERIDDFQREVVRQVRAITRFDRVMFYQFAADHSGHVVAESSRSGLESFLDLHFPPTDIPVQARELYRINPFRIIADIAATPVPILPQGPATPPLDLSHAITRAVSPVHIEYLTNMGVGASLSISILVGGELWGLIACHHYGARLPSFVARTAAELYGQMCSLTLESKLRQASATRDRHARDVGDRMIGAIAGNERLLFDSEWMNRAIGEIVDCDGVCVYMQGDLSCSGSTPPSDEIQHIAKALNGLAAGKVFQTDALAKVLPSATAWAARAAGMLAIPISRRPRDYILLFRREQIVEVKWAGDPAKVVEENARGVRLSPRRSFEQFAELVRGRARPFTDDERRIAETVRASLIEVVLRFSESAGEERRLANERQELLVAELNHRVRNILSLIRGLISQSRGETSVSAYVDSLSGRVQSLARAHDKITRHNWGPGRLASLFEDEIAAYAPGKSERFRFDGLGLWLQPTAFSTLALVVHELVTNCAKYGALSDNGSVHVTVSRDEDDAVVIDWVESGGPAVQPPKRRGFGSTIIERTVPYDLGGTSEVRYALAGLVARFTIPLRHLADPPADAAEREASDVEEAQRANGASSEKPAVEAILTGKSVLLLEDNMIVALEAEELLGELGASPIHVANSMAEAYRLLAEQTIDAAMLDVNLGPETSFPLAEKLAADGVPFLFASGYGDELATQGNVADAVIVAKPFRVDQLHAGFERIFKD